MVNTPLSPMSTRAYHLDRSVIKTLRVASLSNQGSMQDLSGPFDDGAVVDGSRRLFVMKLLWKLAGDERDAEWPCLEGPPARDPALSAETRRYAQDGSLSVPSIEFNYRLPASSKALLEPRTRTVTSDFLSRVDASVGSRRDFYSNTILLSLCLVSLNPPSKHRVPRQQTACPTGKASW
jgi:hypothetical protein